MVEETNSEMHIQCPACGCLHFVDDYFEWSEGTEHKEICEGCGAELKVTMEIVTEFWFKAVKA
jgi:hypothetical protein